MYMCNLYEVFVKNNTLLFTFLNFKTTFLHGFKPQKVSSLDKVSAAVIIYPQTFQNIHRLNKVSAGLPKKL